MPSSTPENFSQYEKLLVDLAQGGVDFAVVGGVAVSLNGFIRATDDVDIIVDESPDNVGKLLDCLSRWGEGWAKELRVEEFVAQEGSIRVMEDFDLDIFTPMRQEPATTERTLPHCRLPVFESIRSSVPGRGPRPGRECRSPS